MKRGQLANLVLILIIALFFFTPIGFHLKVFVNQIIAFNPSQLESDEREELESYNWVLRDADGNSYNLENARGKVVFINFWASWCPPCVAEMPDLNELYLDYESEIEFLFVARDKQSSIEAFMKKKNYTFPVYYEKGLAPAQLNSESLPTTYILDREGNIVVKQKGVAAWNSKSSRNLIQELLQAEHKTVKTTF